ncbi:MAG: Xaa-Pro dipeptidase [Oscillospiraceae bacterium]
MLGECHGHIFMDGKSYRDAVALHKYGVDKLDVRSKLALYKNAGVSFFRDGGDSLGVSVFAREIAPEYGIDYRTPIFAIHKKGLYGGIVGKSFDSILEFRALVEEVKAQRGDFIKIMMSGIMDFNVYGRLSCAPLDMPTAKELIHIAHDEGFSVMVHANGRAVYTALECGADSIEHGNFVSADCADLFVQTGAIFVPTFATVKNLIDDDRFPQNVTGRIHAEHLAFTAKCIKSGVTIACGSDAGAYRVPHPTGVADEKRCFESMGYPIALLEQAQRDVMRRFARH